MHYKINHKDFRVNEAIPKAAGVYTIIALDENESPIEINRLLDTDQSRTLYIGKSEICTNALLTCVEHFHQTINQQNI